MSFTFRGVSAALASLVALAASASVLVAAPASAERVTYKDAAGDVVVSTFTEDFEGAESVTAPEWTGTDIRATRISHNRGEVRVVVRTASRMPWHLSAAVFVRTPRKQAFVVWMRPNLFGGAIFMDMDDEERTCDAAAMTSDKPRRRLTMTIPTRCLGNPVSVRVGVGLSAMPTDETSYDDDGLRTGLSKYGAPKLSKSLKRG